ncbi:HupE/UreJ family protein [Curvibacter delicatus]|uniref:HupE/UreJ family protein n=1 Tax=Curvibacter delicatus TaxID=80879 RepID=UPI000835D218|nr:HupE/UreJ family protein [Curvibacter delicatus]
MKYCSLKHLTVVAAVLGSGMAQAHPGHDVTSLFAGLYHPLALDHLLVMLAVGVWSVCALPARRAWLGPVVFLVTMAGAAALGALGMTVPMLEYAVALSVVLSGVMLWQARQLRVPGSGGELVLIALMGGLHGLAHGAESPAVGFAAYAAGFLLSTAVLHMLGLAAVTGLRHMAVRMVATAVGALGAAIGLAGAFLLAQVGA